MEEAPSPMVVLTAGVPAEAALGGVSLDASVVNALVELMADGKSLGDVSSASAEFALVA